MTAYEMRISDWSSDVCSSDLNWRFRPFRFLRGKRGLRRLSDVGGVKILQIFSGRPKIIIKRIQHLLDIASCRSNPRRCVWLGEGIGRAQWRERVRWYV